MKCEWTSDILQNLISYYGKGAAPKYSDVKEENTIWVLNQKCNDNHKITYNKARFTNIQEKPISKERYLQINDILVNSTGYGTAGRVAQVDYLLGDTTVDSHMIIIRANKLINPQYLAYFMKYKQAVIEGYAEGSTGQTEINRNRLCYEFQVKYPIELSIQKKIAKILSALDDKIECNNQINKNLEDQVSAIYSSWFENFDLYNGECPENWFLGKLSDIAEISSGKRPLIKTNICDSEFCIPIVGAASVMGFTNKANYSERILVTGRVGTHGVIQRFNSQCWASDNTLVIKSRYYEFTNQILKRIDYTSMNRGSTQPLITQGDLNKVKILLPDKDMLDKFEYVAGGLMNQYERNVNENIKLSELRDTLLPKLMSGELDVSDIDI